MSARLRCALSSMISSSSSRANQELNTSSPTAARSRARTRWNSSLSLRPLAGRTHQRRFACPCPLTVFGFVEFIARTARTHRHRLSAPLADRSPLRALWNFQSRPPARQTNPLPAAKQCDRLVLNFTLTPGRDAPARHYLLRQRKTIIFNPNTPQHRWTRRNFHPRSQRPRHRDFDYATQLCHLKKRSGGPPFLIQREVS